VAELRANGRGGAMFQEIKLRARRLLRDVHAVYLAAGDPRVPWYAKLLAAAVAGYALSPIDLIPDFIPVLGYADDLVIVPLGIWMVVSLIPPEVMAECRARADAAAQRPRSATAAAAIIAIWLGAALMLGWIGFSRWRQG
jgi:uncharacterized membrane protein YkvA (DUF1232 family)